ncbi:MAG: hypothetical protein ABH807_02900 [Candidatus Shapirobacteria bacterium]
MKKFCPWFLSLVFFALSVLPVSAEDGTTSAREKVIQEREQLRTETQAKIQTARQEFQTKMAQIKDTRKQALVEKIDQKIAVLNKNRAALMSGHLEKLTAILTRLETKAPDLAEIAAAKKAIETAQNAVTLQAEKQYTAQITTEEALRANLGSQVKTLETDLKTNRQLIQAARQSVTLALQAVKKLGGTSGQPSSSPAPAADN